MDNPPRSAAEHMARINAPALTDDALAELATHSDPAVAQIAKDEIAARTTRLMTSRDTFVCWDGDEEYFPARLLLDEHGRRVTWNGWLVPLFDRATAERIVTVNARIVAQYGVDSVTTFRWYGDTLVERWISDGDGPPPEWPDEVPADDPPGSTDGFTVIRPRVGRYAIGGFSWTWMIASHAPHDFVPMPSPCDVCGTSQREYVHVCSCGHQRHVGPCTGFGRDLDAESMVPPDEACVCPGTDVMEREADERLDLLRVSHEQVDLALYDVDGLAKAQFEGEHDL